MNILLVKPIISPYYVISPNLGLGYLGRIAFNKGHQVHILDSGQANLTWDGFRSLIRNNHFDLIGIQCFSHEVPSVENHIRIIKQEKPETTVIIGGPHPSALPKESLTATGADFAFRGEAEVGFERFIQNNRANWATRTNLQTVPNLCYMDPSSKRSMSNEVSFIQGLDEILFPLWEKMDPNTYPLKPHGTFCKQKPIAPMITSRGCPFLCTFCGGHTVTGRKIRHRSVDNVIDEILVLHRKYGVKEIHIEDDNFTLNRQIVSLFCKELIARNLGLTLNCPNGVRLDSLDPDLIELMEKAGFYSLALGIEFGTDRLLKLTKKNLTIEGISKQVNMIKRHSSIQLTGFFLMGHPDETKEDILQTINFAKSLPLDRASFMPLMPLPRSTIWDEWEGKDRIATSDWRNFFYYRTVNISTLPDATLRRLLIWAMVSFYLRPKVLLEVTRDLLSWQQIKVLLQRLLHIIADSNNVVKNQ